MGGRNDDVFRIVVTDKRSPRDGKYLENVGWYAPKMKSNNFMIKMDRIEYWQKKGAIISPKVLTIIKRQKKISRQKLADMKDDSTSSS